MHVPVIYPPHSWLVAYCRSLMCHLRPGEDLRAELEGKLKPEVSKPIRLLKRRESPFQNVLCT